MDGNMEPVPIQSADDLNDDVTEEEASGTIEEEEILKEIRQLVAATEIEMQSEKDPTARSAKFCSMRDAIYNLVPSESSVSPPRESPSKEREYRALKKVLVPLEETKKEVELKLEDVQDTVARLKKALTEIQKHDELPRGTPEQIEATSLVFFTVEGVEYIKPIRGMESYTLARVEEIKKEFPGCVKKIVKFGDQGNARYNWKAVKKQLLADGAVTNGGIQGYQGVHFEVLNSARLMEVFEGKNEGRPRSAENGERPITDFFKKLSD
eukprot:GHVO01059225.1.p1 GENE.GHVO01059225.1~~GHVO01059225.1.p1  ORF type:complete len:267 (+),score=48.18 GHVO01059225.1:85-885(+)